MGQRGLQGHQRRDFLRVATDHPALWDWAVRWVERVAELYELHRERRTLMNDKDGTDNTSSAAFIEADAKLREQVAQMRQQCDAHLADPQLADPQLAAPAHKVLRVMKSYWPGPVES